MQYSEQTSIARIHKEVVTAKQRSPCQHDKCRIRDGRAGPRQRSTVYELGDTYQAAFPIPGMDPQSIQVTSLRNTITVVRGLQLPSRGRQRCLGGVPLDAV